PCSGGDKNVSGLNALPNAAGNDAAAPSFVSFLATPDAAPAVLSWSAARATSVTVAGPGIGSVDVAQRTGTMDVAGPGGTCPTATYTLTAHPSGAQATQSLACGPPSGNPSLTSQLSASALHPGNTLTITTTLAPGALPMPVDLYLVLRIPDGSLFSLLGNGSVVAGLAPVATNVLPFPITAQALRYTFTGAEPAGTYSWFSVVMRTGTPQIVGTYDQDDFTFGP